MLIVPQWQGSGAPNARNLSAGSRSAGAFVGGVSQVEVAITEAPGDMRGGVRALNELAANLAATKRALADISGPVVTIGGECSVDLAPIAAARSRYGDALTVLWIDAHPDVYAPGELSSGSFHAMILRTLLGEGPAALVPREPLDPRQVRLAGRRVGGDPELAYLARTGLRQHAVADFERVLDGLAGPVYLHIDLDVLDPADFRSVGYSEPHGVTAERLIALAREVPGLIGAAICEYAPGPRPVIAEENLIRELVAAFQF
ncbi:arginase family protein [Knoellia sp. CPCC 206453]|uniref:arginase family protein n=1 Tax=Knoellia pratensis TaxID=3404796 RepID=UPI00361594AD